MERKGTLLLKTKSHFSLLVLTMMYFSVFLNASFRVSSHSHSIARRQYHFMNLTIKKKGKEDILGYIPPIMKIKARHNSICLRWNNITKQPKITSSLNSIKPNNQNSWRFGLQKVYLHRSKQSDESDIAVNEDKTTTENTIDKDNDKVNDDGKTTGKHFKYKLPQIPTGEFKPLQSLGQNFLSDVNYITKICESCRDSSEGGKNVVELGPGPGALSRLLIQKYPQMLAVEIDGRAVDFLQKTIPQLQVLHSDVLQVDWGKIAQIRGGKLSIIGNLPYHITSQILFALIDQHWFINHSTVTMQWEVAQRIISQPKSKEYGILSVLFQLYTIPRIEFKIPNTVFYPVPKVSSACMTMQFKQGDPLQGVSPADLKTVLTSAFQQRRKMLRQSLKGVVANAVAEGTIKEQDVVENNGSINKKENKAQKKPETLLNEKWATKRPEELSPQDFVELTRELFGSRANPKDDMQRKVWRHQRHGQ